MPHDVRPVTGSDIGEVSAVMARAFEDDPIFTWVFPQERGRLHRMIGMNEAMLPGMMKPDFTELYTTPDHAGLAIWAGPERWEPPVRTMLPAVPRLVRAMGLSAVRKFVAAMGALKEVHPHEPHWYLAGIGTEPARQRTGVGSALIHAVLDRCDTQRLPAYLETQKKENVPYYERFGFQVTGEIDLPLGGPHMWLMWREAGAGSLA